MAVRVQPSHGFVMGSRHTRKSGCWWSGPREKRNRTKYFFCDLPASSTLRRLVRIAKCRWKIEQDYHQLKEELGLDHYEGRSWNGWHHHVTLVMLAHSFLTLETLRRKKNFWVDLPRTRREIQYLLFTWTGACAYCGSAVRHSRGP